MITSSFSPNSICEDTASVLRIIHNLQDAKDVSDSVNNNKQKKALSILENHIKTSWNKTVGNFPSDHDVFKLLSLVHILVLDLSEDELHSREAKTILRTIILQDPEQADSVWKILIKTCGSLSETRGSADRSSLQNTLLQTGILLKIPLRYQPDIDQLKIKSHHTLQLLSDLSKINLEHIKLKIQRPSTLILREHVENKSTVVVGDPGAGKSGALHDLAEILFSEQRDVVLLAVEQLEVNTLDKLRDELQIHYDFVEVLRNWHGSKPAFIIIDALDAARSGEAIRALPSLFHFLSNNSGYERWRIVASIRKYDLRYNFDLHKIFSGTPAVKYFDPEFMEINHVNIPKLDDSELKQIQSQSFRLWEVISSSSHELQELIKYPYNLKILAELIDSGISNSEIAPIQTQIDLLNRYWETRVIRYDKKGDARETVLHCVADKMVETRSLRIERGKITDSNNSEILHDLLTSQILSEWQTSPGATPDRYTLTFAHHILFDFAVAKLLFNSNPSNMTDRLASEPDLVIAIRPSLTFHFRELWTKDKTRKMFWDEVFKIIESPKIPQIGKLIGPSVAVELANTFDDLLPVLSIYQNGQEKQKNIVFQTLKYLIGSVSTILDIEKIEVIGIKANIWCDLGEYLSRTIDIQTVFLVRGLVYSLSEIVKDLTQAQIVQLGSAAYQLLLFAWAQSPKLRNSWLVNQALQAVCRTCMGSPEKSEIILRQALKPEHIIDYAFEELPTITQEIITLIKTIPDLVQDIYITAFTFNEISNEKTYIGGSRILSLISNRHQDYEMARFALIEAYPEFIARYPKQAIKALLSIYSKEVKGEIKISEKYFDFFGRIARVSDNYYSFWDYPYALSENAPPKLLQHFVQYLNSISVDDEHENIRRELIQFIVEENCSTSVWKQLLICGTNFPKTLGLEIKPLVWAIPLLTAYNTSIASGRFISALYPSLSIEERERVEKAILSIPTLGLDVGKDSLEKTVNLLIGNLPLDLIVVKDAIVLANKLTSTNSIPSLISLSNEDEFYDNGFREFVDQQQPNKLQEDNSNFQKLNDFVNTFNNSVLSFEEIEKVYPALEEIFEQLKNTKNDQAESRTQIMYWRKISEVCEIIAKQDIDICKTEFGHTIIKILLEACTSIDPEPSPESENQNDEMISWIQSTRTNAAAGIMLISRHSSCNNQTLLSIIETLSHDPVSDVRLQIARYLYLINKIDYQLTWKIAEKYAQEENKFQVLNSLVGNTFVELSKTEPDRILRMIEIILNRSERSKLKSIRSVNMSILMNSYFQQNNPNSYETLLRMIHNPLIYGLEINRFLLNTRNWIRPDLSMPDEAKKIVIERVLPLFVATIHSVCVSIKEWENMHTEVKPLDEGELEYIQSLTQLADTASMEVYFASGALNDKEGINNIAKRPLNHEEKKIFFKRMTQIIIELAEIGHPVVIDHLVKSLESLIIIEPDKVFLMVGNLVHAGKKGGYQFESIAMDTIKRIIERYIAEYRDLLQRNQACRKVLIEILDVFVDAGWTKVQHLVYQLDSIFW